MNAIFMLIFGDPMYVKGGCISAKIHKNYIKQLNLNIEVNVMVDNIIYNNYRDDLLTSYDNIFKLDMIKINVNDKMKNDRYLSCMPYLVNKFQVFNYEQYDKILFLDVDIIVTTQEFYDIFYFNVPSVFTGNEYSKNNDEIDPFFFDKSKIFVSKNIKEKRYNEALRFLSRSINSSIFLISPNKIIYDEYILFLKLCEGNDGIKIHHADEKTFILFLCFYKNLTTYNIPYDFLVDYRYIKNTKYKALNYPVDVKPWIKHLNELTKEEMLWINN